VTDNSGTYALTRFNPGKYLCQQIPCLKGPGCALLSNKPLAMCPRGLAELLVFAIDNGSRMLHVLKVAAHGFDHLAWHVVRGFVVSSTDVFVQLDTVTTSERTVWMNLCNANERVCYDD
jgi:hypothetical protein